MTTLVKFKDIYVNREHISMASLRDDGKTIVVDFSYGSSDGPVFIARTFDSTDLAKDALSLLVGYDTSDDQ